MVPGVRDRLGPHRRGRRRGLTSRRTAAAAPVARHVAIPGFDPRDARLALQRRPVERQVRVRVLQRLHHFGIERPAADPQMGG